MEKFNYSYGIGNCFFVPNNGERRLCAITEIDTNNGIYTLTCIEACPKNGSKITCNITKFDALGLEPIIVLDNEDRIVEEAGIIKILPDERSNQGLTMKLK